MGPISMYICKAHFKITNVCCKDYPMVTQIYSTILRKLKILNYFLIFTNVIYLLLFIYVYNRFCLLVYVKTDNDTYSGKYALTMFTSTKFVITIPIICIFSDNIVRVTSLLLHGVLVQAQ